MDQRPDYFFRHDDDHVQHDDPSYYNDDGQYPEARNYEMDYENRDVDYRNENGYSHNEERGLDNEMTRSLSGSEVMSQNLNANIEIENSQPIAGPSNETNKTPIDYKTELEIHEYNITVNSQLKQLAIKKNSFNCEIKDLRKRLSQTEERYQRKANETIEYKALLMKAQLDLQKEKEKRAIVEASTKELRETTEDLMKQVEDIHKVWPNLQNYVQQQTSHNQNLKEDYDEVSSKLSTCDSDHRKELEHYKSLLETTNKNQTMWTEKITELNADVKNREAALLECQRENVKLEEMNRILKNKSREIESANNECRDAIMEYTSQINDLCGKLEKFKKTNEELLKNWNDLEEKNKEFESEKAQLKSKNVELENKNLELLLTLDKAKEEHSKSAAQLKQELESMNIRINEMVNEHQDQMQKQQTDIKDMANHLDLYKAECEQKIKEELALSENKIKELQHQLSQETERQRVYENNKNHELQAKNNKLKEYESLVADVQRNLGNVNKRLEDKSNETLKLQAELMQLKVTIKSLEDAKMHYQQQIQNKNKENEMLRYAQRLKSEKIAHVAPAKSISTFPPPISSPYSGGESDSSADKNVVYRYFDKSNNKRVKIIPQRELNKELAKAQATKSDKA